MEKVPSISEENKSYLVSLTDKIEAMSEEKGLEEQERIENLKSLTKELLDHIKDDLGLEMSGQIEQLYKEMNRENLIARVESVRKVIECLVSDKNIDVGGEGEINYANSVTTDAEGLRIAMAEADAIGPVRLMLGLDLKTMIGFTNDHIEVREITDDEFDLRDTSLRKAYCRHIRGFIHREDLKYMILRIPRKLFPPDQMTEEEAKMKTPFIFRGAKV